MPRYIDADALKKYILETGFYCDTYADRQYSAEIIDTFPTADVQEVKHGKWMSGKYNFDGNIRTMTVKCSCCGKESVSLFSADGLLWNIEMIYNFCPNCGAKMDGKEADHAQLD